MRSLLPAQSAPSALLFSSAVYAVIDSNTMGKGHLAWDLHDKREQYSANPDPYAERAAQMDPGPKSLIWREFYVGLHLVSLSERLYLPVVTFRHTPEGHSLTDNYH